MSVLINCPLKVEYSVCKKILNPSKVFSFYSFPVFCCREGKTEIWGIHGGMGKVNSALAISLVTREIRPDLIIDSGSCGAIAPEINIGDIIFSVKAYEYDCLGELIPQKIHQGMKVFSILEEHKEFGEKLQAWLKGKPYFLGGQLSGERVIRRKEEKQRLYQLFQASGVNWETAAIFKSSNRIKVPSLSIRVCSDLADENMMQDFYEGLRQNLANLYSFIKELPDKANFLQDFFWAY